MILKTANRRLHSGISMIDTMIAVVLLAIAVIGTSSYRYYVALDSRKAASQTSAASVALLLCESWRGVKGAETYDPITHLSSDLDLVITQSTANVMSELGIGHTIVAVQSAAFTPLGYYAVVSQDINYYAMLSWKDVSVGLRALNVIVAWPQQGQAGDLSQNNVTITGGYKTFALTTYTTN